MIAQELALRSADRCQSLTLVATHGGAPVASLPTLRGMRFFIQGLFGGQKNRMRSLPRLLYPDEFLESIGPKAIRSHLDVRLGHPPALRTVLGQLYAVWRHSTESRLSQIQSPTLLVRPGKDILSKGRGAQCGVARALRAARFRSTTRDSSCRCSRLERCAQLDAPEELAAIVVGLNVVER
jgi:pimeloyl-ACP methyl ester carboxylesterase